MISDYRFKNYFYFFLNVKMYLNNYFKNIYEKMLFTGYFFKKGAEEKMNKNLRHINLLEYFLPGGPPEYLRTSKNNNHSSKYRIYIAKV